MVTMAQDVRIVPRDREIERLPDEPWVRQYMMDVSQGPVRVAKARAPHRTGAGAASIRPEAVSTPDGWEVHAAWDRDHYYMYFHERGTQTLPAHPFLVPAWEGFA